MRFLLEDVGNLAAGASFLGTGGGGDPFSARLLLEHQLRNGAEIELLELAEVSETALIIPTERMGAPSVAIEKIPRGDEAARALRALESHLGQTADATMCVECGGYNSLLPLLVAARLQLPVVDADGKGRAFPLLHMSTYHAGGVAGCPMAICNEHGEVAILQTTTNERMESLARAITVWAGGTAQIALYPMDGRTAKRVAIPGTLSLGVEIGRRLLTRGRRPEARLQSVFEVMKAAGYGFGDVVCEGKVVDVHRRIEDGFLRGHVTIEQFGEAHPISVTFQNEYLVARDGAAVRAIVPDLIIIVEVETLTPVTTERLRFGQRVAVLCVEAPEQLRSESALALVGPESFGLAERYVSFEQLGHQ